LLAKLGLIGLTEPYMETTAKTGQFYLKYFRDVPYANRPAWSKLQNRWHRKLSFLNKFVGASIMARFQTTDGTSTLNIMLPNGKPKRISQ